MHYLRPKGWKTTKTSFEEVYQAREASIQEAKEESMKDWPYKNMKPIPYRIERIYPSLYDLKTGEMIIDVEIRSVPNWESKIFRIQYCPSELNKGQVWEKDASI